MTDEIQQSAARDLLRRAAPLPRAPRPLPEHPLRVALLDLLAEAGTLTSTQAAARLGESSGLCSFHLRQLARHGLIEEAPHPGGRAKPWRLRWESDGVPPSAPAVLPFHEVLHLTPQECAELTASVRDLLTAFRDRVPAPDTTPTTVTVAPHAAPPEPRRSRPHRA
ncbi:winged helix-turn-helix domain-containing protein [Streptomyces cremeus]|uniref:Winged helix-turn-helix domain-containing protein n=1 Tax=Streptomyces cremeus TaxID=66881 RepID=A0ABV5PAX8_STRCM